MQIEAASQRTMCRVRHAVADTSHPGVHQRHGTHRARLLQHVAVVASAQIGPVQRQQLYDREHRAKITEKRAATDALTTLSDRPCCFAGCARILVGQVGTSVWKPLSHANLEPSSPNFRLSILDSSVVLSRYPKARMQDASTIPEHNSEYRLVCELSHTNHLVADVLGCDDSLALLCSSAATPWLTSRQPSTRCSFSPAPHHSTFNFLLHLNCWGGGVQGAGWLSLAQCGLERPVNCNYSQNFPFQFLTALLLPKDAGTVGKRQDCHSQPQTLSVSKTSFTQLRDSADSVTRWQTTALRSAVQRSKGVMRDRSGTLHSLH